MSIDNVRSQLPSLRVSSPNAYGRSIGSVRDVRKLQNALLRGVEGISFTFIDSRVSYIGIGYDDSIKWNDLDEFVTRTAEALSLPTRWNSYHENYEIKRGLFCDDFQLIAEFDYSGRRPLLRLTDRHAVLAYQKRIDTAAERQRLEEEKKRQTFKP
jgi:hypothetical protein